MTLLLQVTLFLHFQIPEAYCLDLDACMIICDETADVYCDEPCGEDQWLCIWDSGPRSVVSALYYYLPGWPQTY